MRHILGSWRLSSDCLFRTIREYICKEKEYVHACGLCIQRKNRRKTSPTSAQFFFFLLLFFRFRLGMHTHLDCTRDHLLFCKVFVSVLFLGHLDVGSSITRFGQGERLL